MNSETGLDNKTLWMIGIIFVFIVLGMVIFAVLKQSELSSGVQNEINTSNGA